MPYLYGQGWDVPFGSLSPLSPQPATVGLLHGRRSYALNGDVIDELAHAEYLYRTLSIAQYQGLLTQLGLTTAKTAPVTVYIQDENYNWIQRNGIVQKPLVGTEGQRRGWILKDFVFLVHSLRALA